MLFSDFHEIAELCRNQIPEALQLEFKEKAAPEKPELDTADKKVIAKAVSAFANSGGGTLILGVRTEKAGDVDVATELKPVPNPELYRAQVEFVCKTNVSPEIAGLEVTALIGPDGKGVVVCVVPASERRPHMSTAPNTHTYYRRTFQGNVPMTPFEVEEQVLAVREALLDPTIKIGAGSTITSMPHWVSIGYGVAFGVENIGSRACLNPFLRVRSSEPPQTFGATFSARLGMWKNNVPWGTIVHVDDSLPFFSFQFIARVFPGDLVAAKKGGLSELLAAIHLYGANDELHSQTVTDKIEIDSLQFDINYGAENSVSRTRSFVFERSEIAARVLLSNAESIRERTRAEVGVWREDLISQLREQYPDG